MDNSPTSNEDRVLDHSKEPKRERDSGSLN